MLACMRLGPTATWPRHIKQEGNNFFIIDLKVMIAPSRASPSGWSNSKQCSSEMFTLALILWTWMILINAWWARNAFIEEVNGNSEMRAFPSCDCAVCCVLSSDFWVRVLKGTTHRACSATSEHLVRRGNRSRRRRGRQKRGSERCVPHFFFLGVYHPFLEVCVPHFFTRCVPHFF